MFVTCLPNFSVMLVVGDLLGCVRRYLLGFRVSIGNLHSDAAKEKGMTKKTKKGPERAVAVQEVLDLWDS